MSIEGSSIGSGDGGSSVSSSVGSVGVAEAAPAVSSPSVDISSSAKDTSADFSSWERFSTPLAPTVKEQVSPLAFRSSTWQTEVKAFDQKNNEDIFSLPKINTVIPPVEERVVSPLAFRGNWETLVSAPKPVVSPVSSEKKFDISQWQTVVQGNSETQTHAVSEHISQSVPEPMIHEATQLEKVREALASLEQEIPMSTQSQEVMDEVLTQATTQEEVASIAVDISPQEESEQVVILDPGTDAVLAVSIPQKEIPENQREVDSLSQNASEIITQATIAEAAGQQEVVQEPEVIAEALVTTQSAQEVVEVLQAAGVPIQQAEVTVEEVIATAIQEKGVVAVVTDTKEIVAPLTQKVEQVVAQQQEQALVTESGQAVVILNAPAVVSQGEQQELAAAVIGESIIPADQLQPEQVVTVVMKEDTSREIAQQVFGNEGKELIVEDQKEIPERELVFVEAVPTQRRRIKAFANAKSLVEENATEVGKKLVASVKSILHTLVSPIADDYDGSLEKASEAIEKEVKEVKDIKKVVPILRDNAPVDIQFAPPMYRQASEREVEKVFNGKKSISLMQLTA